jgi:hypothetical protein
MVEVDSKEINVEMDDSNANIEIDDNNTEININKIDVEFDSSVESIDLDDDVLRVTEKNHSKLENLDYEHSGHTGFASKADIIKDASNINYEDNVGYGVDNVQNALDEAFNSLDNKPEYADLDDLVSYSANQNKNDTQKTRARKNIEAKRDVVNLGEVDLADYDDDFDTFMNTLINEGEYKFDNDVFTYYVEVIKLNNYIGQSYWSTEEGYEYKYFRTIYLDNTGNFDNATNWDNFITFDQVNELYAPKDHIHYKILNTASNIRTYLDTFDQYGKFSISSTLDKEKYWVFTDYYNVKVNGKFEYRRIQRYYSISEPYKVYSRFGLYNTTTKKITWQNWYVNEGVIE